MQQSFIRNEKRHQWKKYLEQQKFAMNRDIVETRMLNNNFGFRKDVAKGLTYLDTYIYNSSKQKRQEIIVEPTHGMIPGTL
jgi:hypothetical protein